MSRHSDATKITAPSLLLEHSMSHRKTASLVGVTKATVRHWLDDHRNGRMTLERLRTDAATAARGGERC